MSRRRISGRRISSRSSGGPGDLIEDSNILETDDPLWYKRVEANNTVLRRSLRLSDGQESPAELDSKSDLEATVSNEWWKRVERFDQSMDGIPPVANKRKKRVVHSNIFVQPSPDDSIITQEEDSLDLLNDKNAKKNKKKERKRPLFLTSKSKENLGSSAYLKVLDDSVATVASDPGPNEGLSKLEPFKNPGNHRASGNYRTDEETTQFSPLKITRKLRPALFNKNRVNQKTKTADNIFSDILDNMSSHSESSIPNINIPREIDKKTDEIIPPDQSSDRILSKKEIVNSEQNQILERETSPILQTNENSSRLLNSSRNASPSNVDSFIPNNSINDSTLKSNSSFIEPQKKKSRVFLSRKRKSSGVNAFENILLNAEESSIKATISNNIDINNTIADNRKDSEESITSKITTIRSQSSSKELPRNTSLDSTSTVVPNKSNLIEREKSISELTKSMNKSISYKNSENERINQELMKNISKVNDDNMNEVEMHSYKDDDNIQSQESYREQTVTSEGSGTVSLSEGQSADVQSESGDALPGTSTRLSSSSRVRRHPKSFILEDSSDEETQEMNNLEEEQSSKPIIIGYEVLNANNFNLKDLKSNKESSQTITNNLQKNTNYREIENPQQNTNYREIENPQLSISVLQGIPVRRSPRNSSYITRSNKSLTIEEEFEQMHAESGNETPSTFLRPSQVSRNIFKNIEKIDDQPHTILNTSETNLEKVLEDDSGVSETPLLLYAKNISREEIDRENEEITSPKKVTQKNLSPVNNSYATDGGKQKKINDFFKETDASSSSHLPKELRGAPLKEIARDKQKLAKVKQAIEVMKETMRRELFKSTLEVTPKPEKVKVKKKTSVKRKSDPKPVHPAYMMNGVVYKKPRLPRPKTWATDRLYKYIWKKIEPKYQLKTRIQSEKFILRLSDFYNRVTKLSIYKNYEKDLEDLMKEMAKMGLIENRKDFNDFCVEFLPYSFVEKVTPIALPGNKTSIPYDPEKLYTPLT